MSAQPTHVDVFSAANHLCASTITEVEGELKIQREADVEQALRRQAEERLKVEMEKIAAKHDALEEQDRLKKIEQDRLDIEAVEHELQIRKQALRDAQKGANTQEDDNDNDDNSSISSPDGQLVHHILICSVHSLLIMMPNLSGNYQGQDEASGG